MKKIAALLLGLFILAGCSTGEPGVDGDAGRAKIVKTFRAKENSEDTKYRIADSFKMADGMHYYLFDVGIIEAAPISIGDEGAYYQGGEMSLSFEMKKSSTEQITNTIKHVASSTISLKEGKSLGTEFAVAEKISAGITSEATHSVTDSFESTVSRAVSTTEQFTQSVTYKFNGSQGQDPGFYCYTSLASLHLYEAVVYNPESSEVKNAAPYVVVGRAFQGLVYSKTSFFEYDYGIIDFDISKVKSFPEPQNAVTKKVTIGFNGNGGTVEEKNREYTIGDAFGALPVANRHGFYFQGWYQGDRKIEGDSLVIFDEPLSAKWSPVLSETFKANGSITSQNAFGPNEEMETATVSLNLAQSFDISYLKSNNYGLKFTLTYNAQFAVFGLGEMIYKIYITNGKRTVFEFQDKISGNVTRQLYSDTVYDYDGTMFLRLHTNNIFGVSVNNLKIAVDFISPL